LQREAGKERNHTGDRKRRGKKSNKLGTNEARGHKKNLARTSRNLDAEDRDGGTASKRSGGSLAGLDGEGRAKTKKTFIIDEKRR